MANFQTEREFLAQLENLFSKKDFAAGLAQAETVLKQFPSSFHLKFLYVKFLKELRKIPDTLQALHEMHAFFGDNIMILKELADLYFQLKQLPASLIYYNKLLFLDSFNSLAQERIKEIQGLLRSRVAEKLADTKIEIRFADGSLAETKEQPFGEVNPAAAPFEMPPDGASAGQSEAVKPPEEKPEGALTEGLDFDTESAAELYFKQGHYAESLAVYKKLFEKTGRQDFYLKCEGIVPLLRNEKSLQTIEKLQHFLQVLKQRGNQVV